MGDFPKHPIAGEDIFVPFGHFSDGGNDAGQEPLIARDSLRQYLIRRLVFGGRQLTCLVTGRRGMGKTSFVRYCLQEYNQHTYERFRRNPAGKSVTDFAVLALITLLSAALAVLVSRVAMVLMMPSPSGGMLFSRFIGWALIVVLVIVPGAFVFKYWSRANRRRRDGLTTWGQKADIFCFLVIGIWMAASLAGRPLAPLHTAVQLMVAYLPVAIFWRHRNTPLVRRVVYCASGSGMPLTYLGVALIILCPQPLGGSGLFSAMPIWPGGAENLKGLAQSALNVLSAIRQTEVKVWTFNTWLAIPACILTATIAAMLPGGEHPESRAAKLLSLMVWILPLAAMLVLVALFSKRLEWALPVLQQLSPAAALVLVAAIFHIVSRWAARGRPLRPAQALRAQFILRLKAAVILATIITLAAPPMVIWWKGKMDTSEVHDGTTILMIVGSVALILIAELLVVARIFGPYGACEEIAELMPKDEEPKGYRDPFRTSDPIVWCRNLERATVAWQCYRVYVPAITVSINLGFDDLDHRNIIQAMLVALRNEYRKVFRDWDAPLMIAARILGGATILVLVMLISTSFFFGLPLNIGIGGAPCENKYDLSKENLRKVNDDIRSRIIDRIKNKYSSYESASYVDNLFNIMVPVYVNSAQNNIKSDKNAVKNDEKLNNITDSPKKIFESMRSVINEIDSTQIKNQDGDDKNTFTLDIKDVDNFHISISTAEQIFEQAMFQGTGAQLLCSIDPSGRLSTVAYFAIVPMPELGQKLKRSDNNLSKKNNKTEIDDNELEKNDKGLKENSRLFRLLSAAPVVGLGERLVDREILAIFQREAPISVRVYHLVLAVIVFLIGRETIGRLLPYRANLRRLDDLLDGLTAKSVYSFGSWGGGRLGRWLRNRFDSPETHTLERDRIDSRVIEESFIRVLTECTVPVRKLPGGRRMWLGMPAPEITFVFDELDKLWAKAPANGTDSKTHLAVSAERLRAMAAARLLSDLKRLISDSPARAIFVGGRLLHDGWLADMHARSQVLTSIFDAEVYLPSLLTDTTRDRSSPSDHAMPGRSGNIWLDKLVIAYFERRYELAWAIADERESNIIRDSFPWFHRRNSRGMLYFGSDRAKYSYRPKFFVENSVDRCPVECNPSWRRRLTYDLAHYLTYRSGGSPKRLREMLAARIRPAQSKRHDEDRLVLGPVDVLKMQLVADIYRHLTQRLERRLAFRDDKVALSALSLTNHLFRFHRRAFNLSNIERMEEVAHIHHAPDIRNLLGEIVDHFLSKFLRPVVNGMYDYRFRSEVAHEIEHISRYSESEMAAFNFTLDESQSLKASYETMLQGDDSQCLDALTALGELHEYDQEYELARSYYGRALRALPAAGSIPGSPERLTWALTCIRLILQIGMTYEQGFNLERAEGEYVAAHHLSQKILSEFLSHDNRCLVLEMEAAKHASLLYQPLFAGAWAAEKLWNDIDTSTVRIEKGLAELRERMPFIHNDSITLTMAADKPAHASFALLVSDLHHKAGDLYFVKGRQVAPANAIDDYANAARAAITGGGPPVETFEGYLVRALHHYALALHEVRRFVFHRIASSPNKLGSCDGSGGTMVASCLPTYIYNSIAGTISNFADALMARMSPAGLMLDEDVSFSDSTSSSLWQVVETWMAHDHGNGGDVLDRAAEVRACVDTASGAFDFGALSDWLGGWVRSESRKLAFVRIPAASERLLFALELYIAGAEARRLGGAPEDAASELFLVARSCASTLWSLRAREQLRNSPVPSQMARHIAKTGLTCLRNASMLLITSKRDRFRTKTDEKQDRSFIIGAVIPPEALTLVCSLGLALPPKLFTADFAAELMSLLQEWGIDGEEEASTQSNLRSLLFSRLKENRYPLVNRLIGIKALIESVLIDGWQDDDFIDGTMLHRLFVEFEDVFSRFASPTLFGYSQAGQVAGLYARAITIDPQRYKLDGPVCTLQEIRRVAFEWLRKGVEMFTHGPTYYEAVRGLYYLYDDFNDRRTHHAHSLEMAGWEISVELLDYLNRPQTGHPMKRD